MELPSCHFLRGETEAQGGGRTCQEHLVGCGRKGFLSTDMNHGIMWLQPFSTSGPRKMMCLGVSCPTGPTRSLPAVCPPQQVLCDKRRQTNPHTLALRQEAEGGFTHCPGGLLTKNAPCLILCVALDHLLKLYPPDSCGVFEVPLLSFPTQ